MLTKWIARQSEGDNKPDALEALTELWEIVSSASDDELSTLLAELTEDRFGSIVEIPLYSQDATELLVRIVDRLLPDADQSDALSQAFPLSWSISVMGGEAFEARPLLNGVVLVRNAHRVLGPSLWDGLSLDMNPELADTLTADLDTLRSRNADGEPSCFLLSHDANGCRLLGSRVPVDLTALGWGQLIAVCALQDEDLEGNSPLRTGAIRRILRKARSMVVFMRFFGDRVDIIPASRFEDDLDVFLEELAIYELGANLEEGMDLPVPLTGDRLTKGIIERIGYETGHLPDEGPGANWFRENAVPTLASRLNSTMTWSTANFGLGPDPDGPRRAVPLPAGVEAAIVADPDLKRRSVTLQVMTFSDPARDMFADGLVFERISEAFEEAKAFGVELAITGRVDHELGADADTPPLTGLEDLTDAFSAELERIAEQAEEEGEDLQDAVVNASLGVVLLIDFPDDRPSDRTIAAMARALSGLTANTVRLFLNGRGEYLAYESGDTDSGDHELFRLDEDAEEDLEDDEGEGAENLTVDVYTRDVDAALAAFKAAVEAGATSVRISSNEAWETGVFDNINLSFEAAPGSVVVSSVKRPPFVRDVSDLDGDVEEPDSEEGFLEEDEPDDWSEDEPDEEWLDEEGLEKPDGDGLGEAEDGEMHSAPSSAISLIKGQNLSLSKTDPGMTKIIIGLGWDPRATDGQECDLDASLFMLGENGKVRSDADFIFYNQKTSGCGSVEHTGDNRTGTGDDEQIRVDLRIVPTEVKRLAVSVTIHDAEARRQSFGQVSSAYIRVLNEDSGAELVRYDLSEEYSTETAMIFGEVYRNNGEWKFRAVGQGYAGGLGAMCAQFGIVV